jgi:hypothetical protein
VGENGLLPQVEMAELLIGHAAGPGIDPVGVDAGGPRMATSHPSAQAAWSDAATGPVELGTTVGTHQASGRWAQSTSTTTEGGTSTASTLPASSAIWWSRMCRERLTAVANWLT